MATLLTTTFNATDHITLPKGTSAQRPVSPVSGMMRYNTTLGFVEFHDGSYWREAATGLYSDLGMASTTPATSGVELKKFRPNYATGNYYIQPPGQSAYLVYVDMNNLGGGWVLVACGREGLQGSNNAWWNDNGSPNGLYTSSLVSSNLSSTTPVYVPSAWVRALTATTYWSEMQSGGMIVNRTALGDSFQIGGYGGGNISNSFNWSQFNSVPSGFTNRHKRYTGTWLTGSLNYDFTSVHWTDTLSNGAPVANDITRLFTWTWTGHSNGSGQYMGWSAGASIFTGFQAASEGHALQQVNVFAR